MGLVGRWAQAWWGGGLSGKWAQWEGRPRYGDEMCLVWKWAQVCFGEVDSVGR